MILNITSLTQPTSILSGDVFTLDYWQSYETLASPEASRERLYELERSSYSSEMIETAQQFYKGDLQAIGNVLPNVALATATAGASVGTQSAVQKQRINTIKSNINADGVALVEQVENIVNLHKEKTALTKADGSLDTVAIDNLELKLDTEIRKYFEMSADYIQEHGFETAEHLLKVIGENPNDTIKRYQKETGVKLDAEGKRALTESDNVE